MTRNRMREFRQLCVAYGEARRYYASADKPGLLKDTWRRICDELWSEIKEFERAAAA